MRCDLCLGESDSLNKGAAYCRYRGKELFLQGVKSLPMSQRSPGIIQSVIPIVVLVGMILFNVFYLSDYTLSGANQLALMVASAVAAAVSVYNGVSWDELLDGIVRTITSALPAIIILLIIGMLSGTWMMSGVVPSMIYYGLKILRQDYFLPATVVL